MGKLVCGVGINDAKYAVNPMVDGKQVMCPFYRVWSNMIQRCYSELKKQRRPSYNDCEVCLEWLTFSNFKVWMEKQDWEGNCLDKDLLFVGNKVYSPEACVFVDSITNSFVTDRLKCRGDFLIGVHWDVRDKKFKSQCRNPITKKKEGVGYFLTQEQAHEAWRKRKHELACQLADLQTDERVATALRLRYA